MTDVKHLTMVELEAGLETVRRSPRTAGVLELIVRRPQLGGREVVDDGELDPAEGLVGDTWNARPSSRTDDGSPHPGMQLTIMNARVIGLLAPDRANWALAGDQLFIDMDLSTDNLTPGTQLAMGSAVVEVSAQPHTGCAKFGKRFGLDAAKWVNSTVGKQLCLRGINTKVVCRGVIRTGDAVNRVSS